jgi:hypothetical protein
MTPGSAATYQARRPALADIAEYVRAKFRFHSGPVLVIEGTVAHRDADIVKATRDNWEPLEVVFDAKKARSPSKSNG